MYTVGQTVHLTGVVTDASGALYDPTSVTVSITDPAGVTVAPAAVRDSLGTYHYDYTPTLVGSYTWRFSGTGTSQLPDIFTVTAAATSALVSLADVKNQLNITKSTDDDELWRYLQAATEIINTECGYTAATPSTETVGLSRADMSGTRTVVLSRTPVLSVTSVTPQMQGMPIYDLTALNINNEAGIIYFSNWFQFYGPMKIAYVAGRGFVPPALQTACLMIVQDMWKTQRGGAVAALGVDADESGSPTYGIPYQALQLMRMSPYFAAPGIA